MVMNSVEKLGWNGRGVRVAAVTGGTVLAVVMFCFVLTASAKRLELPALSPAAQVMQRVGLTDITVTYSSPAVRKRAIWGKLVPWGKNWRTGANAATTIRFSREVKFGGKLVKAGIYSLFTLPAKNGNWTVILNSNTKVWGSRGYKKALDVARVRVKAVASAHRERMTFIFDGTTDNSTTLALEWEKLRVPVTISVDTKAHALANVNKKLGKAWRPFYMAARYFLRIGDVASAEAKIKKSIEIKSTWANQWIMATILEKKGDKAGALKLAKSALADGAKAKAPAFIGFYRARIKAAIAKWSK